MNAVLVRRNSVNDGSIGRSTSQPFGREPVWIAVNQCGHRPPQRKITRNIDRERRLPTTPFRIKDNDLVQIIAVRNNQAQSPDSHS